MTEASATQGTQRSLTVAALVLAIFMSAMEATVVATAMPTVIADLGGVMLYGWVSAAYLLASTVTVPLYGKLADRYGRKPVLLLGIAAFLAGSLLSGLSGSIEQLIAFRALQGLGAGAVQPIVFTVIGDLYAPHERGRVQGLFGAVWAIAGVAGPLLGAEIVHSLSWPWIFWVNLPIGAASAAMLFTSYREAKRPASASHAPLDIAGATAILVSSLALLVASSGVAPIPLAIFGALSAALFVWIERRAADPVLPFSLVGRRLIGVSSAAMFLLGGAMLATLIFLPLHVQGVMHGGPRETGLVIAPMLVGWPIASAITSRALTRIGYRWPVWIGAALASGGLALLQWLVGWRAPLPWLGVSMCIFGLGMGLVNTALLIGVQASVSWEQRGVVTATLMFARSMGGALGVGGLGALLAWHLGQRVSADRVDALLDASRRVEALRDTAVTDALASSLGPLFWAGALAAAAAMLVVLWHPRDEAKPQPAAIPTAAE